jgi:hypothetical protein
MGLMDGFWCGRGDLNSHALAGAATSRLCVCQFRHFRVVDYILLEPTSSNSYLKLVRLPIPPPPQTWAISIYYFFGVAGAGMAGAEVFVGCRSKAVPVPEPLFLVAMIDNEIEVSIKTTVEIVVAFDSSVADPRGPKAV